MTPDTAITPAQDTPVTPAERRTRLLGFLADVAKGGCLRLDSRLISSRPVVEGEDLAMLREALEQFKP